MQNDWKTAQIGGQLTEPNIFEPVHEAPGNGHITGHR